MSNPTEPKYVHLQGLWSRIRFLAVIPHGRGTREVAVDVPPELILRLADALRATQGTACDTKYSRHCDDSEDGLHITHAIWHVQHPDEPMPCIDHSTVIDMGALPVGDDEP